MSDLRFERIELRGIRAWGRHGANAGEQDVPQPLDVDLTLEADLRAARASDDLADTVDYAALHATVAGVVRTQRFRLLERLADAILDAVMRDPRIAVARVSIAKPGLLDGATPVVSVSRVRDGAFERAPQPG
ncbi:MAG TPA: dihydroneopterin aldolase [Candidatus Elarobacter sp.]|nr:dihydroneopterin aldolase [Candidatus Elarobacter sp.]